MSSDDNEERGLKRLSVRELRQRAVKSLGSKVAAGLKLKDELVSALSARAAKAVAPVKKAAAKAAASKAKPKAAPAKAAKAAPEKGKAAEKPAAKSSAKKVPVTRFAKKGQAKKQSAPVQRESPPQAASSTEPAPPTREAAEVYELPITRDFFIDPRRAGLPASYGDDRLLCFRREPLAIVVSWDLSAATFADGQGLVLELLTTKGRLVGSVPVATPTGLATFDHLPEGTPLSVQVVRRGRVMTRGRPFMLGAAQGEGADAPWQMTVPPDGPLSDADAEPWADAPPGARARAGRASSSRLSS
jgi:hypothetical protein